jgi:REP element-mobilizing transposase RayT
MEATPLAYFLTWTTYGTWLPGDERGWVDGVTHEMHFAGSPERQERARSAMTESAITLDESQRKVVTQAIADHCRIRGWTLHIVNVRTNHVHVVVSCDVTPEKARDEFKAWGTRRLKVGNPGRQHWWTEKGSKRPIWTEDDLERVIVYVRDMQ